MADLASITCKLFWSGEEQDTVVAAVVSAPAWTFSLTLPKEQTAAIPENIVSWLKVTLVDTTGDTLVAGPFFLNAVETNDRDILDALSFNRGSDVSFTGEVTEEQASLTGISGTVTRKVLSIGPGGAFSPVGQLSLKTDADGYHPTIAPPYIRTQGYSVVGIGGALYKKEASEPSHAFKFSITTAGNTTVWYGLAKSEYPGATVDMVGALGDSNGTTGNGTNDTAAFIASQTLGVPIGMRNGACYRLMSTVAYAAGFVGTREAEIYPDPAGFTNKSVLFSDRYGSNAVVFMAKGELVGPDYVPLARARLRGFTINMGMGNASAGDGAGLYIQAVVAWNVSNAQITDLEIKNFPGGSGVNVNSVTSGKIDGNDIHDFYSNTGNHFPVLIQVDNDTVGNIDSIGLSISDNDLHDALYGQTAYTADGTYQPDAIDILGRTTSNLRIKGNRIARVGKGITIFGHDIVVTDNELDKCFNYGIALEKGAKGCTVAVNGLTDCGASGIVLIPEAGSDCSGNNVTDNTVTRVGVDDWVDYLAGHWSTPGKEPACATVWPDVSGALTTKNLFGNNVFDPGALGKWAVADFGGILTKNDWIGNHVVQPGTGGISTRPTARLGRFTHEPLIVESNVPAANAVSLASNGTPSDITSILVQPGPHVIHASAGVVPTSSTVVVDVVTSISTASQTLDQTQGHSDGKIFPTSYTPGINVNLQWGLPAACVNPTVPTTYYLVGFGVFNTSTLKAYGKMTAIPVWG